MTTEQHPITPPSPELVERWIKEPGGLNAVHVAAQAARWGADEELEACLDQLRRWGIQGVENLRNTRRPKPPSLAEQALAKTEAILNDPSRALLTEVREALELNRRALERLQELEEGNE